MDHKQKLESVKRQLLEHPKARQYLDSLEKNFPEELDQMLKNEATTKALVSQALSLEREAESMEESMEESMGSGQAQMESTRMLSQPPE